MLPVGIAAVILIILLAFRVSPWPGVLIIRADFNNNGGKVLEKMKKHALSSPVTVVSDQQYISNDRHAMLDVYYPQDTPAGTKLPVIVWTHGGAWISGDKADDAPYFKLLAEKGFTVVGVNYTLAPEATYPTPVYELSNAYAYIEAHADRLHADMNKVVLAGDSAGANLSAQMAAIITNPDYAREVGVTPTLQPEQLRGVVLNCGIYMMNGLVTPDPALPKLIGWGTDVSVWAYSGTRDFADPVILQMSPYYHVTKDFPSTYISGGNADPLTDAQSKPMAQKLKGLGIDVTSRFFPADHEPKLPHEYQFDLDNEDGRNAFAATVDFVKKVTQK